MTKGLGLSTHATSEVQVAFEEKAKRSAVTPVSGKVTIFAAPTIDMTIYEIYLEFRTAPIGSLAASSAIAETAIFTGGRLLPAFGAGYEVGTGINYLITSYAPELGDAIGGTIYGIIQNINAAASNIQRGQYEQGLRR
ncbi:hypothetical protein [Collimonas antrihumi]|uniref:hypothetical protein n=1 Tax=Collimonas antrihumi TaxID=1940615 RepID=UPI001B8D386D|nr:hypothetical protein [Collimonas antrihumi]